MLATIYGETLPKEHQYVKTWNEKSTILIGPAPFTREMIELLKDSALQEYYTYIPNISAIEVCSNIAAQK